jgi:hypothetical protein
VYAATVSWWLKRAYWSERREDASSWRSWTELTDPPGRRSKWWRSEPRPRTGDVYPRRGPHYKKGDLIVLCIAQGRGSPDDLVRRCPAIYEVTGEPYWDPDLVDSEPETTRWGRDGDKWAVLTPVSCVHAVNTRDAPFAEGFGFELQRGNRAVFMGLDDVLGEEAQRQLEEQEGGRVGKKRTRARSDERVVTRLPIEEGDIEGYDIRTKAESRKAKLAERRLVVEYTHYLRQQGDSADRSKIKAMHGRGTLYTDVFNYTRNQLIEAKAHGSRAEVRMALGQLADYGRFYLDTKPDRAILLPAKPEPELLALLEYQGVAVIWREGTGFRDNVGGRFT